MALVDATITDKVRLTPTDVPVLQRPAIAIDGVGLAEYLLTYYGAIVREALRVGDRSIGNQIGQVTVAESFRLIDTLAKAREARLSDGIGVHLVQQLQTSVRVLERLRLPDTLAAAGTYHISVEQGLRLVATLGRFYGVEMIEAVGIDSVAAVGQMFAAKLAETVQLGIALTPHLLLNVVLDDGIELDDAELIRMVFAPAVVEGIAIEAGYLSPDGSFTTWAMNTRSGAVTEYADYAFNSFAKIGRRYFAASENGLYELTGDSDDGEDIVARIRSGFLQFGGTQLSRLKEAYLAARGGGNFVLRVVTGDGAIYNYSVASANMRSTKVHMGKGMRARYFAYELISTGQDFDLDTLEFVPLVVQRRV